MYFQLWWAAVGAVPAQCQGEARHRKFTSGCKAAAGIGMDGPHYIER